MPLVNVKPREGIFTEKQTHRRALVVPGLRNRILAFSVRLSPRVLVTKIAAYQA